MEIVGNVFVQSDGITVMIMKSKALRNIVLFKYNSGDYPRKIFHDLSGGLAWRTLKKNLAIRNHFYA